MTQRQSKQAKLFIPTVSLRLVAVTIMSPAVLQQILLALPPFPLLPWAAMPLMAHTLYYPLLAMGFLPRGDLISSLGSGDNAFSAIVYSTMSLFTFAATWAAVLITLFCLSVLSAMNKVQMPGTWHLTLLRYMLVLSQHALVIPVSSSLMSPWNAPAQGYWMDTGMRSLVASHLTCLILGVLLLVAFVAIVASHALLAVNRTPDPVARRNVLGANHGRMDCVMVLNKVLFSMVWILAGTTGALNGWGYSVIMLVLQGGSALLSYRFLPYFALRVNQITCAAHGIIIGADICTLIALAVNQPSSNALAMVLIAVVPNAAYVAYTQAGQRWREMVLKEGDSSAIDAQQVYDVDLRARCTLATAGSSYVQVNEQSSSRPGKQGYSSGNGTIPGLEMDLVSGTCKTHVRPVNSSSGPSCWGVSASHPSVLAVEQMFGKVASVSSAPLHMCFAHFLQHAKQNKHLERVHLRLAAAFADPSALDIRFFIWQRLTEMDTELESKSTFSGIIQRKVQVEQLSASVKGDVTAARALLLEFWTQLEERHPDMVRVRSIGAALNRLIQDITSRYSAMLDLVPQSSTTMRAFADFLLEIANDPVRAASLLADAEQIEDELSRSHGQSTIRQDLLLGMLVPDFDVTGENAAVIRVSCEPGYEGIVVEANPSALKLLGRNKIELVGKDVSAIIPEPIASKHPDFIRHYTYTGEEAIMHTSRILFFQSGAGHIFPVQINIRRYGNHWVALFEEVKTSDWFIWLVETDGRWQVTAACQGCMSICDVNPDAVRSGTITANSILRENMSILIKNLASAGPLAGCNATVRGREGDFAVRAKMQFMTLPSGSDNFCILRLARTLHSPNPHSFLAAQQDMHLEMCPALKHTSTPHTGEGAAPGSIPEFTDEVSHEPHVAPKYPQSSPIRLQSESLNDRDDDDIDSTLCQQDEPEPDHDTAQDAPAKFHAPEALSAPNRNRHRSDDSPSAGVQKAAKRAAFVSAVEKPATGHYAASVHSKGSAASANSTNATLRRGVLAHAHTLEPSLTRLQNVIVISFVIVGLLNLASLLVSNLLFGLMEANMNLVKVNGDRAIHLQAAASAAQQLIMHSDGRINLDEGVGLARTEEWLRYNARQFATLHEYLYQKVDGAVQQEVDIYTKPNVWFIDLVPGSYLNPDTFTSTDRQVSLTNAGLEYVSKAEQFLSYNATMRDRKYPVVSWMDHAGPDCAHRGLRNLSGLRSALNSSMMYADERSQGQTEVIQRADIVVLSVSLSLLLLLAAVVMTPAVAYVAESQDKVFQMFLEVPIPIIRALANGVRFRIQSAQRAEENEDDVGVAVGEDEEEAINADAELSAALSALRNATRSSHHLLGDDANKSAVERCCRCRRRSEGKPRTKGTRQYRRSKSLHSKLLLRLVWPLTIFVAYYIGTYFWKSEAVSNAAHTRAETLWIKQVEFFTPQIVYALRLAFRTCNPDNGMYATRRGLNGIGFSDHLLNGILYGDDARGLRPSLQRYAPAAQLFMNDACVQNTLFYNMTTCTNTFLNGLLSRSGLRAAVTEYLELARQAFAERAMQFGTPSCTFRRIDGGELQSIAMLGEIYLPPALNVASTLISDSGLSELRSFTSANIGVTLVSVIALLLFYILLYKPMIRLLDKDIKDCRGLLLLFPDAVAQTVPAIVEAGRNLTTSAGASE